MEYNSLDKEYEAITQRNSQEMKEKKRGFWGDVGANIAEIPEQAIGGPADFVNETSRTMDSLYDWGTKNLPKLQNDTDHLFGKLPTTDEPDTVTGELVRTATQFLTGVIPMTGGMKVLGIGNKLVRTLAAGGLTEGIGFDPQEDTLAEMTSTWAKHSDAPISQYLENNPLSSGVEDSELEARIKNSVEGMLMDTGFECLGKVLPKALKVFKKTHAPERYDTALKKIKDMTDEEVEQLGKAEKAQRVIFDGSVEPTEAEDGFIDGILNGDLEKAADYGEHLRMETDLGRDNFYKKFEAKADQKITETFGDTKEMADQMDMSWDELVGDSKGRGTENLAAQITKKRKVVHFIEKTMRDLSQKENMTDKDLLAFKKMTALHYDARKHLKGEVTEIGRALNAMKINSIHYHGSNIDDASRMVLDSQGGKKEIRNMMVKMANADTETISHVTTDMYEKAGFWDNVQTYWINGLLSGLGTHTRNFVGNCVSPFFRTLELGVASARRGGQTEFSDALAFMQGNVEGAMEALGLKTGYFKGGVKEAFKKGQSQIDPQRTFLDTSKHVTPQTRMGKFSKIIGAAGDIGTLPSRVMVSMDDFFKTASYRGELRMQAAQKAHGVAKAERKQFLEDALNHPDVGMKAKAGDWMRMSTFQNDMGSWGQGLQYLTNHKSPAGRAAKFVMPFVRTPTNLLKFVGHRTPGLQRFSKQIQAEIAAGGTRKELAEAKVVTGSMFYGMGLALAGSGVITGGADKEKHNAGRFAGKGEYKFKVGDHWYDFSTADPIGSFFALMADTHELLQEAEEGEVDSYLSTLTAAATSIISEKSYLRGLSQALTALTGAGIGDNQSQLKWWAGDFASSFIPNIAKQVNRAHIDGIMRETNSMLDAIRGDMIGLSKDVKPKRDPVYGKPMEYGSSGLLGTMPFYRSEESDDPVFQELSRLEHPKEPVGRNLEGVELSPEEHERFQKIVTQGIKDGQGRTLGARLKSIINSPSYDKLPEATTVHDERMTKQKIIDQVFSDFRRAGKKRFLRENRSVLDKIRRLEHGEQL